MPSMPPSDRHAEDGEGGHRGGHAGKVRGTAGAGDDQLAVARPSPGRIVLRRLGVRWATRSSLRGRRRACGVSAGGASSPVGVAAHDDSTGGSLIKLPDCPKAMSEKLITAV